jgi:hypothetical protein
MRNTLAAAYVAVAALLITVAPSVAHHSFAAEFDRNKPITLKGTITKVEWMNPHAWIYVNVKGADGKVVNWALETGSPNGLTRQGWSRKSLKEGDEVTVNAFRAKDGTNTASISRITFADGRSVVGANTDDGAPKQ